MSVTRRAFLETTAVTMAAASAAAAEGVDDGPVTDRFAPVRLNGNVSFAELEQAGLSETLRRGLDRAPRGKCVSWGIPFEIRRPILLRDEAVVEKLAGLKAGWLVFLHTADLKPLPVDGRGFVSPMRGEGYLNEKVAEYVLIYADGSEERSDVRRRHQIGTLRRRWGENCFQAVAHRKPRPVLPVHQQPSYPTVTGWGRRETRALSSDSGPWVNWLWAWENPHPEKEIAAIRFEPVVGTTIVSAVSAGSATAHPLRWLSRRKAVLKLPDGVEFDDSLDEEGRWRQIQLDMGQIISAEPRLIYPNSSWTETYNNQLPEQAEGELVVEYTAHPDARFHLIGKKTIPAADLNDSGPGALVEIPPATQRVTIRAVDASSRKPVPVKLHVHGGQGEYLAPVDRHRQPNPAWFEDYSPEFQHSGQHCCVYIPGETVVDLPLGKVYLEVSKGFEIRPVRRVFEVTKTTEEIEVEIEKVLPWRERGWVTADTHVHFLSPNTARLEGSAEGVNVVNLLASQWGELMTNAGDFDGETTLGSKANGGDGEWLVRVGTENRQHVLGHISLLGYDGNIIAPMCSGGPDEAALGDPIGVLLMEWAEQCKAQNGLVVLPHFPNPRCENAADLVSGVIDGVEMTSWGNLYAGIDPYSLSDYYRYLNCGYFIAAVGGTDKMTAVTAVGTVRTYSKLPAGREFDFGEWKNTVRSGNTFVTYGPLVEFTVDGKPAGSRIELKAGGGTLDVSWEVASVTVPMTKVELVVNGEVRESAAVDADKGEGNWKLKVDKSSWVALMVRGHYADKPEIIAAHTSPVMIPVEGSDFFSAVDALTMLEQVEGALAYIDTVGTRAEDAVYKRLRMRLTGVYRKLHNELHQRGHFHEHGAGTGHS